jgi:para-nitrobenzyl esterase
MFVAPTYAFADAYSAHAPSYVYRFDHAPLALLATGLGALSRRLHPLGT